MTTPNRLHFWHAFACRKRLSFNATFVRAHPEVPKRCSRLDRLLLRVATVNVPHNHAHRSTKSKNLSLNPNWGPQGDNYAGLAKPQLMSEPLLLQLSQNSKRNGSRCHRGEGQGQGCNPFALWGKMTPTTNLEPAILAVWCELELALEAGSSIDEQRNPAYKASSNLDPCQKS